MMESHSTMDVVNWEQALQSVQLSPTMGRPTQPPTKALPEV